MEQEIKQIKEEITKHNQDDLVFQDLVVKWQDGQEKYHKMRDEKLDIFMETMLPLTELANGFKGINLLKRPSLWVLAIVLGFVAFFGGIKGLLAIIINILR